MIDHINSISLLWWDYMLAMFWQVGLLIIVIACIDALIKKWAWPQLRHALWLLVLLKLVLPPSFAVPGSMTGRLRPLAGRFIEYTTSEPAPRAAEKMPNLLVSGRPLIAPAQSFTSTSQTTIDLPKTQPVIRDHTIEVSAVEPPGPKLSWQSYVMTVWLFGVLVLGGWLLSRLRRLSAGSSRSSACPMPQSFYETMSRCAERLGLHRLPRVVITNEIVCPAVFGVFRPVLLMPRNYLRTLSRKDVEHMLLHELAHVKRGDSVVHGLYILLQIVYWFNPLLWLARKQLHHLRELCCDATVARLLRNKTYEYRETLIDVARRYLTKSVEPGLGLLGLFEDSNRLLVRLNWLEKETWRYKNMKNIIVITIVGLMLAFVLPMSKAQESTDHGRITAPEHEETPYAFTTSSQHTDGEGVSEEQLEALNAQLRQLEVEKQKLEAEIQKLSETKNKAEETKYTLEKAKELQKALSKTQKWSDQLNNYKNNKVRLSWDHDPDSEQAKQWQHDMKQWREQMAEWQKQLQHFGESLRTGEGNLEQLSKGLVLPAMPEMPHIAGMPQIPEDADVSVSVDDVDIVSLPKSRLNINATAVADLPDAKMSSSNMILPTPGEVKIEKDDEGKFTAVTVMEFDLKVKSGADIEIKNTIGSIDLKPGPNSRCSMKAVIRGKADTEEQAREKVNLISISTDSTDKKFFIKPVKQDKDNWNNLNVDLYVSVPLGSKIDVSTSVGSIKLSNLKGQIKSVTSVGSIKAVNTSGDVQLTTSVGGIDFVVPKDFSARLRAKTDNGSIKSDVPLEINKKNFIASEASGTFGDGEGDIVLSTSVGSIKISSQDSSGVNIESPASQDMEEPNSAARAVMAQLSSIVKLPKVTADVKSVSEKTEGDRSVIERIELMATPLSDGSELDVTNEDGDITVQGTDTDKCQVEATFTIKAPTSEAVKELSEKISLDMKPTDKGLSLSVAHPKSMPKNNSYQVDFKITVPRNTNLTVRNEDGDIQITDIAGQLRISHEDGDIKIKNINGQIKVGHEDGDIECENIVGDIDLALEDGKIAIKNGRMTNCRIRLEDGTIRCEDVTGSFDVQFEDSTVSIGYAENVSEKYSVVCKGEDGDVTIKNGTFTKCLVNMESGKINCDKVAGNLEFKLEDGSVAIGYADAVPENCTINVRIEEGDIRLSAPAGMFPADGPSSATRKDDGAVWTTKVETAGGGRSVSLKVDEGSIKIDKR